MEHDCECGDDAAAYVLGALEQDDAERFRRHLEGCPECREELVALRATAAVLPLSAPRLELPDSLRRRVLAEVRAEARGVSPGRAAGRTRRPARRWELSGPLVGAGALALAAIVAVLVIALPGGRDLRVYRATVSFPAARASLRVGDGRPELVMTRMPAPPSGKVYEVWLARGRGRPAPAGALFDVGATGSASVLVPDDLRGVQAVMVTAEPLGGSRTPTADPVIVARLS